MFGRGADIGIDLGTASVLIYIKEKGIVIQEPSVIAINKYTNEIVAIGQEAHAMIGRTPQNIQVIRPLRRGAVDDYDMTEKMLKYFIQKAAGSRLFRPRIAVCVPSGVTDVEKRAVEDATRQAGARRVDIIEEPIAAATGAGIDIAQPYGSMIVDIGGGTTDIAVISLGDAVVKESIKVAGDNFDLAIVDYVKKKYKLLIGERTAEKAKQEIGTVFEVQEGVELKIRGRDMLSGLPNEITLTSSDMFEALKNCAWDILDAVHRVLELTPPELAADISDRGIVLTGGGSLINGLDKIIERSTGINTRIAESPITCVAIGTGVFVEIKYSHKRGRTSW